MAAVPDIELPAFICVYLRFHWFSRPSSEEPGRSPEQDGDRGNVDEESTELGHPVFAGGIGDADQQGGDERSAQATQPADGDDDQEVDQLLERVGRLYCDEVRAESSAQPREAAAEREGQRK